MPPYLTPLQIFENYKKANPQKCKGKSTTEICRLAGLSAKQIAELKTTSAWLFSFEKENTNSSPDFNITEIFGGNFNQTKRKSKVQPNFKGYSEGLDRHINKIQIATSDIMDDEKFCNKDKTPKLKSVVIPQLKRIGLELGISIMPLDTEGKYRIWIEDYIIRLHDNTLYAPNTNFELNDEEVLKNTARAKKGSKDVQGGAIFCGSSSRYIKSLKNRDVNVGKSYIEGGNALISNNSNGQPSVILGEDTLYCTLQALKLKPSPQNIEKAKKIIAKELHVESKNVVYIPQHDFHIDMYYRPLHNGQIAVPDYSSAIELLENIDFGIDIESKKYLINRLKYTDEKLGNILKDAEKELTKNNYEIIKVPCFNIPAYDDYYDGDSKKLKKINYMNGICGTTTKGTTFYITNSSGYKKLDDYMKKFFKEIGIDKTYFVSTQNLLHFGGGLDCITQEK